MDSVADETPFVVTRDKAVAHLRFCRPQAAIWSTPDVMGALRARAEKRVGAFTALEGKEGLLF